MRIELALFKLNSQTRGRCQLSDGENISVNEMNEHSGWSPWFIIANIWFIMPMVEVNV